VAPLEKVPVFQRGGAIVPRQMRPRRSSALMRDDPYTIVVTLDGESRASGQLYLDDGATYDFARRGLFRLRSFEYAPAAGGKTHVLRATQAAGGKAFAPSNGVERIIVAGVGGKAPSAVTASDASSAGAGRALDFTYDAANDVLTIRKPDVKIAYDWTVTVSF
jgi:alpha 1,3-glucosidase